ncbi:BMC domain-containing protein [Paenibacillus sp. SC116]|uniref:BMC domain-containing protein n=1 Tax=Paenibacillus sp. SC116 TaxID=2968986 RepID=UPI00215A0F8C|nr:BMC domain-containing protein [Paenibacillus sp. SC116]MCR8843519.1 BMC domain-containing protein [Paenibacillus sp. SC116]
MRHNALGLIEVRGYLGAIAAVDAALKAAHVTCLGIERVKDGFRMIKLSGDVGAVQSAVDAGAEVAVQLDVLVTRHVIARMHEETAAMVLGSNDAGDKKAASAAAKEASTAEADQNVAAPSNAVPSAQAEEASAQVKAATEETSVTLEHAIVGEATIDSPKANRAETTTTKHQEAAQSANASLADTTNRQANKENNTKELTSLTSKQSEAAGKPEVKLEAKPTVAPVKPTAPSAAKRSKHKKKASS